MEASKNVVTFAQYNLSIGITGGQGGRNPLKDLLLHNKHLHNVRSLKSNYPCISVYLGFL